MGFRVGFVGCALNVGFILRRCAVKREIRGRKGEYSLLYLRSGCRYINDIFVYLRIMDIKSYVVRFLPMTQI